MVLRFAVITLVGVSLLRALDEPKLSGSEQISIPADQAVPPPPMACPAGTPLGTIDLRVRTLKNPDSLPFQTINHLSEGDVLTYAPIDRGKQKRPGEVSLVMVPAKRDPDKPALIVSDLKPANKSQEWKIPQTISLAAFVYGPEGLSKRKVEGFLSQDDLLIAQLADYAERTSQTEALLEALSNNDSSAAGMNAALSGFASQYGFSVQLEKTAPPAVQAQTLFASMNPQLANYNPLASSPAERVGQTASLATAAATLFFGSPIGIAAGGTAMLLDLRSIAFPNTQFRSSFAQPSARTGLDLCGQRGMAPAHTRVAYIWASRIPNTPTPAIKLTQTAYIARGQKTAVPVEVPDTQWKYLQRAHAWTLENDKGQKIPAPVVKLGNQRALEIDLDRTNVPIGDYRLAGYWDWARFEASGLLHVRQLSDFKDAQLQPTSQDRLLAHAGKVPVTVAGSDFEFVSKVELKKSNDEFASAESVRFILPEGLRNGPQSHMDVQIDTQNLDPGKYQLLLSQEDGKSHVVNLSILPNPPKINNLPILVNQGIVSQHYVLKGERLDLLAKLEAPGARLDLGLTAEGGAERNITVQLTSNPQPGTLLNVEGHLIDRSRTLSLPEALLITGPLPVIASSKVSYPAGMVVAPKSDEFPAGYTLSAMLDVKNIEPKSSLRLACAEGIGEDSRLEIGEQNSTFSLQQLSQDQLFLLYDTSKLPAGCSLQATIDNGRGGRSVPFTLAHIVRLPRIASFEPSNDVAPSGLKSYALSGFNLEMIEKAGWDENNGIQIPDLPIPIPGQGQQQLLTLNLPDPPAPHARLIIWLRGETVGRPTTTTLASNGSGATGSAGGAAPKAADTGHSSAGGSH